MSGWIRSWNETTEDRIDLDDAKTLLDRDHHGMDRPKDRLIEFLAVHKLKQNLRVRSCAWSALRASVRARSHELWPRRWGERWCASASAACATSAEITLRHRRTYVGVPRGRLIKALRQAGSMNPVIVLDELDKLGSDYRGDPCAALLEVLDPEQNDAFVDHYLDVPVDLSAVMFVGTANTLRLIPPA